MIGMRNQQEMIFVLCALQKWSPTNFLARNVFEKLCIGARVCGCYNGTDMIGGWGAAMCGALRRHFLAKLAPRNVDAEMPVASTRQAAGVLPVQHAAAAGPTAHHCGARDALAGAQGVGAGTPHQVPLPPDIHVQNV